MKKNILLFYALLLSVSIQAQKIYTVNNTPGTAADFRELNTAINSDSVRDGDILYVQHSTIVYKGVSTYKKRVKIIGRSSRDRKFQPMVKSIALGNGSDSLEIIGLKIIESISSKNTKVTGVKIINNTIGGILIGYVNVGSNNIDESFLIQGNVIQGGLTLSRFAKNCIVSNNILLGKLTIKREWGKQKNGNQIFNNIFANPQKLAIESESGYSIPISNSIFINNSAIDSLIELVGKFNIENCLTYNYGAGNLTFTTGDDIILNDVQENVDPKFVNVDSTDPKSIAGTALGWDPYNDDLHLQEDSPFDGKCLYEGYNFNNLGLPQGIPSTKIKVFSPTVNTGDTLKVTIKAQTN